MPDSRLVQITRFFSLVDGERTELSKVSTVLTSEGFETIIESNEDDDGPFDDFAIVYTNREQALGGHRALAELLHYSFNEQDEFKVYLEHFFGNNEPQVKSAHPNIFTIEDFD